MHWQLNYFYNGNNYSDTKILRLHSNKDTSSNEKSCANNVLQNEKMFSKTSFI